MNKYLCYKGKKSTRQNCKKYFERLDSNTPGYLGSGFIFISQLSSIMDVLFLASRIQHGRDTPDVLEKARSGHRQQEQEQRECKEPGEARKSPRCRQEVLSL